MYYGSSHGSGAFPYKVAQQGLHASIISGLAQFPTSGISLSRVLEKEALARCCGVARTE